MDWGLVVSVVLVLNAVAYVSFVRRRGEGGLLWTVVLALFAGPLVWFVWWGMRAGGAAAEDTSPSR